MQGIFKCFAIARHIIISSNKPTLNSEAKFDALVSGSCSLRKRILAGKSAGAISVFPHTTLSNKASYMKVYCS